MIAQNFIGLFAPARTSPAIIEQVAQATRGVMDDEAFLRSLTASGFEPELASTPGQDPALRRGRGRPLGSGHQGDRSQARLSVNAVPSFRGAPTGASPESIITGWEYGFRARRYAASGRREING